MKLEAREVGLIAAALALVADQGSKLFMLYGADFAHLPPGQSGQPAQEPVQSAMARTTTGVAANAAVLADSSTTAAISFFMISFL